MSLSAGSHVGPYEILASLGAGGMGEVYRARDLQLGREVAIKVLPAAWSADRERLQRFDQEARAAAALNHPNILAVYGVGQHDGSPYIVSELLEGETLRERLDGGALPVRKAIELAVQAAHGLAAAHEKSIVHRDLKPENIFVTSDGRLKILDFGLAKLTQPDTAVADASALPTTPPNTHPGIVLGTIGYMSPEQVRGIAADHRADIFAFGLVLFEMLSGRRAFHRETGVETMAAILKEDPPDLRLTERHIPPALKRIVDRCVEKSPAARFQSAADLGFALEALSTQSDSAIVAVPETSRAPALRRLLPWVAAILLLGTTIVFAARQLFAPSASAPVIRFQIAPPLGGIFPGANNIPRMAVSPDGQYFAFTANLLDGKPEQLWIRRLDSIEATPLPNTAVGAVDPVQQPFWSPDSKFVGFFADSRLRKVDIASRNVQTVANVPGTANYGGTWNRDGIILFGTVSTKGLQRVTADGGSPSQVTTLDESRNEIQHLWPQFLPDGRHFLYFALGESPKDHMVYAGSIESGERKIVLKSEHMAYFVAPDHLFFVRDRALMVQRFDAGAMELRDTPIQVAEGVQASDVNGRVGITASETGLMIYRPATGSAEADSELVWFDRAGRQLGSIGTPSRYRGVELSPDDRQVAVHREGSPGTGDLWVIDLQRGSTARFTFDASDHSMSPIWSPDGRRILFSRQADTAWSVYEKASSGAGSEQLVYGAKSSAAIVPLSVSPDGTLVARTDNGTSLADLSVLTFPDGLRLSPYLDGPFNETHGRLSPNGRWMAYASNETGRSEIYVQSFPSPGTKYAVSTAGGVQPRWRRDGRELFFLAQPPGLTSVGPNTVMAVGIETSGDGLKFGIPQALFNSYAYTPFHGAAIPFQYSVTSDGQRFLIARQLATGSANPGEIPLIVVLNWNSAHNPR